jgi:hypothetical protein
MAMRKPPKIPACNRRAARCQKYGQFREQSYGRLAQKCSTPMNLAPVAPDEEGIEDRIFPRPNCGNSESWIFKS